MKSVLSQLSELRYQLQTNKPMSSIENGEDVKEWKAAFDSIRKCKRLQGSQPSWYSVSWLFAECFMYRKISDALKSRQGCVIEWYSISMQFDDITGETVHLI